MTPRKAFLRLLTRRRILKYHRKKYKNTKEHGPDFTYAYICTELNMFTATNVYTHNVMYMYVKRINT